MPRKGRLHIPGGCYHVIGRGLERRYIFQESSDKLDFLMRLEKSLSRSEAQCLAWAMMSNHYHLLIRVGTQPLSKLMAPLLGGYGSNYNRRHGRVGYVFQNRFKSILCEEDSYLLELVRYIHLNPVRANMVIELNALDRYPWTGHAGIVGKCKYAWHAIDEVLGLFGESRREAKKAYRDFMRDGFDLSDSGAYSGGGLIRSSGFWESASMLRSEHVRCIGDERILGSGQFVQRALEEDELRVNRSTLRRQQGWTIERLLSCVCSAYKVEKHQLFSKARGNKLAIAKSLICYWGVVELGLTMTEIGRSLKISQQSVSKWVEKGRLHSESEKLNFDQLSC